MDEALRAFENRDPNKSFEIFRDHAERGDSAAQYNLGVFYETGTAVLSDDDVAEKWYRKAAEQGLAESQFQLATILAADIMAGQATYNAGEESERIVEAYMWLILANNRGHSVASTGLSRLEPHMTEEQIKEAEKRAQQRIDR